MLTGTTDFDYILDLMVTKGQIDQDTADTYLTTYDGYRLRFMMVGMKTALDTEDDTEAICLYHWVAGGALCAGLRYNGSSIVPYAEWIKAGLFTVSLNSGVKLNDTGVDQAAQWFPQGVDGTTTYTADGTDASYWSVFKF